LTKEWKPLLLETLRKEAGYQQQARQLQVLNLDWVRV
jgi:hypothetical protein